MREMGRIRFQWPIYRSVVEESYPNSSIYDKAHRIQNLPGPREACIVDWVDSEFGTIEQITVDVPIHRLNQASETCSAEELEYFNAKELSSRFSKKARTQKRKPLPHGILTRAMYLALARLRSGPNGQIVPLDSTYTPLAIDTTALVATRALRVQVRRRLWCFETPVIADGEITVRRADKSDNDRVSLSPHPPRKQGGKEHDLR